MLRNAIDVLISEEDVFLVVEVHLQVKNLLLTSLDLFLYQVAVFELARLQLEIEDDHAVLPSLQGQILGHTPLLELNQHVVADVHVLTTEHRRKVLPVSVGDGVV